MTLILRPIIHHHECIHVFIGSSFLAFQIKKIIIHKSTEWTIQWWLEDFQQKQISLHSIVITLKHNSNWLWVTSLLSLFIQLIVYKKVSQIQSEPNVKIQGCVTQTLIAAQAEENKTREKEEKGEEMFCPTVQVIIIPAALWWTLLLDQHKMT